MVTTKLSHYPVCIKRPCNVRHLECARYETSFCLLSKYLSIVTFDQSISLKSGSALHTDLSLGQSWQAGGGRAWLGVERARLWSLAWNARSHHCLLRLRHRRTTTASLLSFAACLTFGRKMARVPSSLLLIVAVVASGTTPAAAAATCSCGGSIAGAVLGTFFGTLILVAVILLILWCCCLKHRFQRRQPLGKGRMCYMLAMFFKDLFTLVCGTPMYRYDVLYMMAPNFYFVQIFYVQIFKFIFDRKYSQLKIIKL